jgi:hypothetical protein
MAESNAMEVGIRIDTTTGVAFFGVEEVNRQIAAGRRVKEVRPAGAIMTKVGENAEDVRLTLSGCKIEIVFEDP